MPAKQYKVLTVKGSRFTGKFDPQDLETVLNGHAADGWQVVDSTWKSMTSEVMIILERDAQ